MKLIGRANNGQAIVELAPGEFNILVNFYRISQGETISQIENGFHPPRDEEQFEGDLRIGLRAVLAWMNIKDKANSLRSLANHINDDLQILTKD